MTEHQYIYEGSCWRFLEKKLQIDDHIINNQFDYQWVRVLTKWKETSSYRLHTQNHFRLAIHGLACRGHCTLFSLGSECWCALSRLKQNGGNRLNSLHEMRSSPHGLLLCKYSVHCMHRFRTWRKGISKSAWLYLDRCVYIPDEELLVYCITSLNVLQASICMHRVIMFAAASPSIWLLLWELQTDGLLFNCLSPIMVTTTANATRCFLWICIVIETLNKAYIHCRRHTDVLVNPWFYVLEVPAVTAQFSVPTSLTYSCRVHVPKTNVHFGFNFEVTQQLKEKESHDSKCALLKLFIVTAWTPPPPSRNI